jgi:hypothetical protein
MSQKPTVQSDYLKSCLVNLYTKEERNLFRNIKVFLFVRNQKLQLFSIGLDSQYKKNSGGRKASKGHVYSRA